MALDLFSPVKLGAISLSNRMVMAPLTRNRAGEAGVPQDLIRISVGLEDIEDILWDLDQALTTATGSVR